MAAAAPLVVSRRAAHGLTDGVQARVVDDAGMAPAIASLLAAPAAARDMGLRARAHVETAHDPARSAALLEETFLKCSQGEGGDREGRDPISPSLPVNGQRGPRE
jgi:hypothetical protein